jgi:hypothetical protein
LNCVTLDLSINTHNKDPQPHPSVREAQYWLTKKVRKIVQDGEFGEETHDATKEFQKKIGFLEVDGVIGSKTWHQLSYSHGCSPLSTAMAKGLSGRALRDLAYKLFTGRFVNPQGFKIQYVFGAEVNVFDLPRIRSLDCSEGVQACVSALTGKVWLDGSQNQYHGCTKIPVSTAMRTPGALVFITNNHSSTGIHHVGVCFGDGVRTIEARSAHTSPEVGVFDGRGRFNLAGTVPGFHYDFPHS